MKVKQPALSLFIALLLFANLHTRGNDSLITYTNAHHGISFKYPSSWKCSRMTSDIFSIEIKNPVEIEESLNNYRSTIVIVAYGKGDAATILGEGMASLKKEGEELKGYHFISEGVQQINKIQFFSKSFSYEDAGRTVYQNLFYSMVGNRIIVIKQSAVQPNLLLVGELDEILNSFTAISPYSENRREMSDSLVKP
ncbi:MAG: hypothetical protein IT223_07620, partial [Crocinitomicaceae bacterium]|nr:hypothetical protein [Crocinitomicaceae bacterium]